MKRKDLEDPNYKKIEELKAKLHEKEEENRNLRRRMEGVESRLDKLENGHVQEPTTSPHQSPLSESNQHLPEVSS